MTKVLSLICLILLAACSTAQTSYSSKNKKAIALFEEGKDAPGKTMDMTNGGPNYKEGIKLMDKALEKDPTFWEAHMLAGEFAEYSGQVPLAIEHYRAALAINPTHSPSGSTYFYLGNLEYTNGEYDNAIKTLNIYIRNQRANPELVKQANEIISSSEFSLTAIKNASPIEPVNLGPGVNTADPEYFPTITVDGQTILFTRLITDERVFGPIKKQEDFYVSLLSDKNTWSKATPMPSNVNTVNNEGAPTIAADGRSLIFVACPDASGEDYGANRTGKGSCDMFITQRLGAKWIDPVNLPGAVNTVNWETQPSLSSDGKTLYFIRGMRGRGGQRDSDIYTSTKKDDGTWGEAVKLSNVVNTPYQEESVLIHPDGKTLYFSSQGHKGLGGLDIFVSRMDASGNWGVPENLGYPINSRADENSLMVSADGEIAFFASDREGGYGDLDIYYFVMPEQFRPTRTLYFDGLVYEVGSKKPLAGKFSLIDLKTGKEVIRSEADPVTGAFTVSLPINREYALSVSYPNYNNYSANFNMTVAEDQEAVHLDVPMVPITDVVTVNPLKNVFFDLGKATLRPESSVELNKLRDFLKSNPTIRIEIAGHTDTRDDAAANLLLSQNRAKAVYEYLVAQGIDAKRLSYKGFGETQPIISDEKIAAMSNEKEKEKAHQENRRTEYRIIQ